MRPRDHAEFFRVEDREERTVHILRRTLIGASAIGLAAVLVIAAIPSGAPAGAVPPTLPQATAALGAARWLAGQLTPQGTIDDVTPGTADLSATAQTVIALGATGVDLNGARAGLAYLKANSTNYISQQGSDGPGQLANLILAAHSLGANPTNFGGTDLVQRLLATEQTSPASTPAGSAPMPRTPTSTRAPSTKVLPWLPWPPQTCTLMLHRSTGSRVNSVPMGGGLTPTTRRRRVTRTPSGVHFPNEDTNTTSFAIQGLAAQSALTSPVSTDALGFLTAGQAADGGWNFSPSTTANPETSDPDSTSLVIQALVALGQSPT